MQVLLLVLLFFSAAFGSGGLRISVSNSAVNSVGQGFLRQLSTQSFAIPEGPKTKFHCAGTCYLQTKGGTITNIRCSTATFSSSSFSLSSCSAHAHIDYEAHRSTFPSFSCHGSIDTNLGGFSVSGSLSYARDANGELVVQSSNVATHLSSASVDLHGNEFCKLIGDQEKKTISNDIVNGFNTQGGPAIQKVLQAELSKLSFPTSVKLLNGAVTLNTQLVSNPVVDGNGISIELDGRASPAVACDALGTPVFAGSKFVDAQIGSCVGNSLLAALYAGKFLQTPTFTVPYHNLTVTGSAYAVFAPVVTTASINVTIGLSITAPIIAVFEADVVFPYTLALSNAGQLTGKVSGVTVESLKLVNKTGTFDLSKYESAVKIAIILEVLPKVNEALAKGIALPTSAFGFHLTDEALSVQSSNFEIAANFQKTVPMASTSNKVKIV